MHLCGTTNYHYATGGTNYAWTPSVGSMLMMLHDVQPGATTVYTVTGTNNAGPGDHT